MEKIEETVTRRKKHVLRNTSHAGVERVAGDTVGKAFLRVGPDTQDQILQLLGGAFRQASLRQEIFDAVEMAGFEFSFDPAIAKAMQHAFAKAKEEVNPPREESAKTYETSNLSDQPDSERKKPSDPWSP